MNHQCVLAAKKANHILACDVPSRLKVSGPFMFSFGCPFADVDILIAFDRHT